jgi:hypothetical protein
MAPSHTDPLQDGSSSSNHPPSASSSSNSNSGSSSSRHLVPSPVLHPQRPTLPGRQSSFYSLIGEDEREDTTAPLFLGLDCSSTALKISVLSEQLLLVKEEEVNFDQDLKQFG